MQRLARTWWIAALVCACTGSQPPVSTRPAPTSISPAADPDAADGVMEDAATDAVDEVTDAAVNQTSATGVASPAMKVIPPSKASCDLFRAKLRDLRPSREERECEMPEGGCYTVLSQGCLDCYFRMLATYVLGGHGTVDDLKIAKAMCTQRGDSLCVSCVEWLAR